MLFRLRRLQRSPRASSGCGRPTPSYVAAMRRNKCGTIVGGAFVYDRLTILIESLNGDLPKYQKHGNEPTYEEENTVNFLGRAQA